ncbi:hypothetical protein B0H13DRAFT_2542698 [Mycena leptocephala]|nr:hypothetical protein B0H13DRAFT_2542698 [Mycena leptocephala]
MKEDKMEPGKAVRHWQAAEHSRVLARPYRPRPTPSLPTSSPSSKPAPSSAPISAIIGHRAQTHPSALHTHPRHSPPRSTGFALIYAGCVVGGIVGSVARVPVGVQSQEDNGLFQITVVVVDDWVFLLIAVGQIPFGFQLVMLLGLFTVKP